jgi:hypothetical protein
MTLEQIKYAIIKNKLGIIYVKSVKEGTRIARLEGSTPQALASELEEFIAECPAKAYKLEGNINYKSTHESNYHFEYFQDRVQTNEVMQGSHYPREEKVDIEKITDGIRKEFEREYEVRERKKKLDESESDLKKKHADLETMGGRFMVIFEMVGPSVMQKLMAMFAPQLAGMMQQESVNLQGLTQGDNMTEQEKIDKAFQILGKLVTADQLLEFAQTLEAKPHLIEWLPKLKNF